MNQTNPSFISKSQLLINFLRREGMIRKSNECRVEQVPNLMGGEGVLQRTHFFEMEDFNGKGRLFGKFLLTPGQSIGYHIHSNEQEAYLITKGEALFNDDGVETVLHPGDVGICKNGHYHGIKNVGNSDLEFIALIIFA
jgi:mannose-6-phosphate isomerase-like protein (cupin superfamily)